MAHTILLTSDRAGTPDSQRYLSENTVQHIQTTSLRYPSYPTKTMWLGEIYFFLDPPMAYYVLLTQMKAMKTRLSSRWVILDRAFHKLAGSMAVGPLTSTLPWLAFGPLRIWKHLLLGHPMYVHPISEMYIPNSDFYPKLISWINL